MLSVRRTYLVVLAILVTAFVALYPYLEGMGPCMVGECPYATQSSREGSTGFAAYVSAVLAASVTLFFAASRGRRVVEAESRPAEPYLSPDPPPPRLSSGL